MDLGVFFLFIGGIVVIIIGTANVVHGIRKGGKDQKPAIVALTLFIALMACFGHFLYQTFALDENLAIAAGDGDIAQVRSLLSRGADPNGQFEGMTAEEETQEHGYGAIVVLLQRAEAKH